ncbi:MAG: bacterioferritin [Candidatus Poribacteria bacterium]|nr:bacterioferritin [Candidatus Poribacteria bacterium]
MASEKLKEMLNQAIARELTVSIQYMWQHVQEKGITGETLKNTLRKISIVEMKHAEDIAERLNYLGGTPTTQPEPINVGKTVHEMIQLDKKQEEDAIQLYRSIIDLADHENDSVTRRLFESILAQEEEHHDFFSRVLE